MVQYICMHAINQPLKYEIAPLHDTSENPRKRDGIKLERRVRMKKEEKLK